MDMDNGMGPMGVSCSDYSGSPRESWCVGCGRALGVITPAQERERYERGTDCDGDEGPVCAACGDDL
jgi:hypothetical protein